MIDGQSWEKSSLHSARPSIWWSVAGWTRGAGRDAASARSFGRVLHQLWLEVTGFTFLAMAAVGAMAVIRDMAGTSRATPRDRGGGAGDLFYAFVHMVRSKLVLAREQASIETAQLS